MKKLLIITVLSLFSFCVYSQSDYLQRDLLGRNTEFIKRTKTALIKVSTNVAGEDSAGMGLNKFNKRADLANIVFSAHDEQALYFAEHIAALGTVSVVVQADTLNYTGGSTLDNDIEFTITTIWDDRAGVTFIDENE